MKSGKTQVNNFINSETQHSGGQKIDKTWLNM